ncbi:MAG: flavodoxin FldA [Cyanobacteria bacterium P01_A01_bin.83]
MAKIGIFYGSTAGVTEEIAEKLAEYFEEGECALYNMEDDFDDFDDMLQYDYLLLGSSTWGSGEVQNDWRDPLVDLEEERPDFTGKTIAFFGAGDCGTHGENFVSALGTLYDYFKDAGATIVGDVSTDGYTFSKSNAVRDGKFIGLPIDEINESEKTDERLEAWVESLRPIFV